METAMSYNLCRCCASEGNFKDLEKTYDWLGTEEVYADILKDCFDISLTKQNNFYNGGICEVCITQLRNANNFKKQVQMTEQQFLNKIDEENGFKTSIIKIEVPRPDDHDNIFQDGNLSDGFSSPEYDLPLTKIKLEKMNEAKPKKRAIEASTSKAKKLKKERGEPSSKRTDDDSTNKKRKRAFTTPATPERSEHRVNLTVILKHSNATPFKDKSMRGFSCLYCSKYFRELDGLRAHTAQPLEKSKLNSILDYKLSYNPIKLDITDLRCLVCDTTMNDLAHLKEHLVKEHNKLIYQNIKDIIIPFRLKEGHSFVCVICSVVHVSFKNLYHHMSTHYRNYCCETCGDGYITIAALRKHYKSHYKGDFPCEYCHKTFHSPAKRKHHESGVHIHGWKKKHKCQYCSALFGNYYDRAAHLALEHNTVAVLYPCNACDKKYKRKFELSKHIRNHHLQEKKFSCDKCPASFYTKRGLDDHSLKHAGVKAFRCDVCGKTFSRQTSLTNHMKSHTAGGDYQCDICKRTFSHKRTLHNHIKLHQDHLDIFKEFDDVKHLIDDREMTLKEIAEENRKKASAAKNDQSVI